ncbi:tumor protein p63-regulated gene 1-like protein isoform X2 [Mizuhopecten yessoensis]|uniref:Tumor protein p63-regulated gene 1-like protein n=1 Tax=Mizuhopecten yessoensis TaxID=6573 RepID=A0A210PUZ7_MIZYE|nr:tumor protein p63-regulated gene 1-like protein isoform X2 [Mizuhopecten yessoensis]OWF40321.1 Tumor protein p63-regulated gene 1-like protein [Mizuhopecten yessoensis]
MADTQTRVPQDTHLEDDRSHVEGQFMGATLQIGGGGPGGEGAEPEVKFAGGPAPGFNRQQRPGSVYGRQSVKSTTSRTSMRPGVIKDEKLAQNFFSYKETNFDKAVSVCEQKAKPELDGKRVGAWLLTEIDHWDNEREKIVLLFENSVMIYKYHFILHKVEEFKRVLLWVVDTVCIGDFKYPEKSIMPERKHGGIQIRWNKGEEPSFAQRWNPWSTCIPFLTFCHHPLLYNPKENETVTYNVDEFYESLIKGISDAYKSKRPAEKVTILEGPILITSYASVSSMIFNQSGLGFYLDRNGICF